MERRVKKTRLEEMRKGVRKGRNVEGRGEKQGRPGAPVITCRDNRSAHGLKAAAITFFFQAILSDNFCNQMKMVINHVYEIILSNKF